MATVEWVFPVIWAAIFVGFYLTEGRTTAREWRLRLFGRTVAGRVTEVRQSPGRYGLVTTGSVQYTSEHGEHTVSGHLDPGMAVGTEFSVRYLPSKPQVAVISEGVVMLVFKTIVIIVVSVILTLIALSLTLVELKGSA